MPPLKRYACVPSIAKETSVNNPTVCSIVDSCNSHSDLWSCVGLDLCREAPRCGGGYCKPNYGATRGYSCVCEGGVVKAEPCAFSKSSSDHWKLRPFLTSISLSLSACPIKSCGSQGICVETDGLVATPGSRPIYYVCMCKGGYIAASDCEGKESDIRKRIDTYLLSIDALGTAVVTAATTACGAKGRPYPSRNPNNPIGCFCKNGTHIEEIPENAVAPLCIWSETLVHARKIEHSFRSYLKKEFHFTNPITRFN